MIDLLFNDKVLAILVMASMTVAVLSTLSLSFISHLFSDEMHKFLIYSDAASIAMLVFVLVFTSQIRYHATYESDWRQVYANDVKAEIELEADNGVSFKAGDRIDTDYLKFK